ncbi:MAG TPA: hypothetical protein PKC66_22975, partial [Leptospiraceae bacterium]|nr:hypothetical protein [Leptospiraceae bacterium]
MNRLYTILILITILSCTADRKLNDPTEQLKGFRCEGNDYYVDYICEDEKEYLDWAASYPKYRKLSDLTREVLFNIMKETNDIDKAAAVFYHRAITEPTNRKFIEYIYTKQNEFMRKVPDYSSKKMLFAIAPGMFYRD